MKERLTAADVLRYLEFGRELSSVEFKSAGSGKDRPFLGVVVRAMLGMTNTRDGGYVIIGVEESDAGAAIVDFPADDLASWSHDSLADFVARYASQPIQFDLYHLEIENQDVVVIGVEEFGELPIICARQLHVGHRQILRQGALYLRPRRKPETVEVSTLADMRDLVDLATEKSLRRLVGRVQGAGVQLRSGRSPYASELEAFRCPLQGKIEDRGYWHIVIRPNEYRERIESPLELRRQMRDLTVQSAGWSFPFYEHDEVRLGEHSVHSSVDFSTWVQCWRFFSSAQLVVQQGIRDDWTDQQYPDSASGNWEHGTDLDIATTICLFSDVWEIAARIAQLDAVSEGIQIAVAVYGLAGRGLRYSFPRRSGFMRQPRSTIPSFSLESTYEIDDLLASPLEHAMGQLARLFHRFAWDVSTENLVELAERAGCLHAS